MNWDQIEGKWKLFTGSARERWGKLTDDDFEKAAGKKEKLVGKIQERYGIAKQKAERQVEEWSAALEESAHEVRSSMRKDENRKGGGDESRKPK